MKLLIQRVSSAKVEVSQKIVGSIDQGILAFLGIHKEDTENCIQSYIKKIINLRIFSDREDKMNLSLKDIGGKVLLVSQFTLIGNCEKGRRPSFIDSAPPNIAKLLYETFIEQLKQEIGKENVETGVFGANMQVHLTNDGPVTFIL
ncbi:MAG: D-tyrosyl-tRNA(Tyr) deacylase [Simkaniaceae bacterium]|nr:D-tyrosyl-tRNA(Tyr) deacylase [Simkaniaceae bacterium]